MSAPYDIVAYAYKADLYCPECIVAELTPDAVVMALSTEEKLDWIALDNGIDRQDETTYDSGDFPKVVFRDMLDGDEHCGHCHTRLGE